MARTAYDETPYVSGPMRTTHPDFLATHARLLGLPAAAPDRCRLLELGCGDGGNLIPMACVLPESHFVGIDLSTVQIESGCALCSELELENIELHAADIEEFKPPGEFDYIVCHGVFSWVPESIQNRILEICRKHLAPTGVAYISYNAFPGWHLRAIVRDMVLFETRDIKSPEDRVRQARAYLKFLSDSLHASSPLGPLLASAVDLFNTSPDWYLLHEYLAENNRPLYFHEFMARAEEYSLQYLGECAEGARLENFSAATQKTVRDISESWLDIEQHVDFLTTRTFRKSLLCHRDVKLSRTADAEVISQFAASAQAAPGGAFEQTTDDSAMEFRKEDGPVITTNNPIIKSTLWELWHCLPDSIGLHDLTSRVQQRLSAAGRNVPLTLPTVAEAMVRCYLGGLVNLHVWVPELPGPTQQRPVASRLARIQSQSRDMLVNLRHQLVDLSPLSRQLLMLLDGTRTREDILEILGAQLAAGELAVELPADSTSDPAGPGRFLREQMEQCIHELAHKALLVPSPERAGK